MSTRRANPEKNTPTAARVVDRLLVKLAIISPFALLVLLASDLAREASWLAILVGLSIAFVWSWIDINQ